MFILFLFSCSLWSATSFEVSLTDVSKDQESRLRRIASQLEENVYLVKLNLLNRPLKSSFVAGNPSYTVM
jgi:hypothetical protein